MAIACPYCDHVINLKSPKPGRYRPKCPGCAKPFLLTVPEQHEFACAVRALTPDTQDASGARSHPSARSIVIAPTQQPAPAIELPKTTPDPRIKALAGPAEMSEEEAYRPPNAEIRGYQIERELGRGGMGAVYLARQLSLDRSVALKVMSKRWATDPVFVARFTREAFAAAQLSHPNIVHIHDIGEVDGSRFFSMEYVNGLSLADVVKKQGKLDPEVAVGYVLQAARGLKHAHDRGMIHRDVKPDNLLLDDQGLVKVADLGLVRMRNAECGMRNEEQEPKLDLASTPHSAFRVPHSDLTGAKIALGTPAYMSPEQCRDAASVDQRADIYSLGCTLYVLVTGRPPFDGTTAVELMSKHAYEPLVPPEQIVSRVPKELSAVIQRMMAKHAEDRFANMAEVVRTLEAWLGVHHAGTFCPQEEQINRIEAYVQEFNAAPTAQLRGRIVGGYFSVVALAVVLLLFFGKYPWAFGVFGLAVQSTLAYFVLTGVARRTYLFTRVRELASGLSWGDYGMAAVGIALFAVLLWMLNVFWMWIGFGLLGVAGAFALRCGLDRTLEAERRLPLDGCERLLRRLRMQGLGEEDLHTFVAKFSGRHWEEFFEEMFGYEAKVTARTVLLRGVSAGQREKHAAWREPLIHAIDSTLKARKEARERKLLQAIEQAQLIANGTPPTDAVNRAKATAHAMVRGAEVVRFAETQRARIGHGAQTAHATESPANVRDIVRAAENPEFAFTVPPTKPASDPFGTFVWLFVGPHVRALSAACLLAACALWAHQNGLVPGAEFKKQAEQAIETSDLSELQKQAAF
ncbi:MAG TPA: serine/threonine-protein kinase, partial [Gemmataceae bacterium]|nr:serine/threonine-protein kinase [Gemmataceae bacterium]